MTPAPASTCPDRGDILLLVNPAKKRRLVIEATLAGVLMIFLLAPGSPMRRWAQAQDHRDEVSKMAPTMERLAAQGKPDAIIWVARNEPSKDDGRLATLAASGNDEALFLLGAKTWPHDDAKALQLLKASAVAGYVPAVKAELHVPRRQVTAWR